MVALTKGLGRVSGWGVVVLFVVCLVWLLLGGVGCATRFSHTEPTKARSADVWKVWVDVKRWPTWDTELKRSELKGSFRKGAKGTLWPKGGPKSSFRVTRYKEGKAYTYIVPLPGAELVVARYFQKKQGVLVFTHDVQFRGAFGWFFAGVLGGKYKKALPKVMKKLKAIAEAKEAKRAPPAKAKGAPKVPN